MVVSRETGQQPNSIDGMMMESAGNPSQSKTVAREQGDFLLHVLAAVTHPIYVIDANTLAIKLSNQRLDSDGKSEGSTCHAVLHGNDGPCDGYACVCPVIQVKNTKKPCTIEHTHRDSEGKVSLCEVHAYPVLDADGNVSHVIECHLDITERKAAEVRLKEQLRFVETLLDTIPNPVFYKDGDGRYIGCNRAFEEFTGTPISTIIGKSAFDAGPREIAQQHHEKDQELFRQPGKQHYEWLMRDAKGGIRDVMFDKATFADPDGRIRGLVGVISDITDRKQAEEELRARKGLLSHIISNMPAFVFWKDLNSTYLGCNEAFAKAAGLDKPEDIVGKTDHNLIWRNEADFYRRCDKEVMESGRPQLNLEEPQTREDGSQITLLTSKVPLRDASGEVIGVLGIYADITKLKRAEEEAATLAKLADESPNPVLRITPDGTLIYANKAAEAVPAFSGIQVGKPLPEAWASLARGVFDERQIREVDLDCGGPTFSITLTPITMGGYVNVYATDVTERVMAEQRQSALLDELEATNRELNDFAHVASHDLKAPLRGIHTIADWLIADFGDRLGEDGKEKLQLLARRIDRMHNLINGILDYSRVVHVRENRVSVDLNQCLANVVDGLAPPEHITVSVADDLPTVLAEPTRMVQLFQNLLSNAIKYMDKDHGLVRVGWTEEGNQWRFSVSDNGPGIADCHFERIFQFFQTLAPRDDREGTGIGLTIAKKIVESHGGRIWLESRLGEGTTFFFTLPATQEETLDAARKADVAC